MKCHTVAIGRYDTPLTSVRRVVDAVDGFKGLTVNDRVFIKPNIVFWTRAVTFPKWGVVTTSRVVEDVVRLLSDHGVRHIVIGEGMITAEPKDDATPAHAFEQLGYQRLKDRYGVVPVNVFDRPFTSIDLGSGVTLKFAVDAVESDFIVNLPVMKAHNQTVVSLGIKNLKGLIDINSRKTCHNADPERDLHFHIARLADAMPSMLTVYDGIFTNERGPGFDGKMHRSDILLAARDVLSGDMVGARVLGHEPADVPHLAHAAANHGRPVDLSDVRVTGLAIADVARPHAYDFEYSEETGGALPLPLARQGIRGLSYRKYDTSMCTYCSALNGVILSAIRFAWKGEPFDDVEVLTGKMMRPTPGKKKTILLGRCMTKANRNHPDILEAIPVKGCPPKPEDVVAAFHRAGIPVDSGLFQGMDRLPGLFMEKYKDRPEFDEAFFCVDAPATPDTERNRR